ncbi:hypothetical protein IVB29_25730 [Bradyrhizobium sp. 1]|nr:hypothetical protein [Bradyrhizobium sp. 1]MCK1394145.1 hypothetical protein [Bradyrhizobium sp. 1]
MPTDLMRASAPPATRRSNVRNANIVAVAMTAALVALQLVGLAMLERSHAQPVSSSQVSGSEPVLCTGSVEVPVPQLHYD